MTRPIDAGGRPLRDELAAIARWIAPGSSVLDLGCGDGALLAWLQREKGCRCVGVELDDAKVLACAAQGVEVVQQNLEDGLALFSDASFDFVLQLETLQMVVHTEGDPARARARRSREHRQLPELRVTGRTASRSRAAACRSRSRCRTSGTTRRTCASRRSPTSSTSRRRSGFTLRDRFALRGDRVVRFLPNLFGNVAVFRLAGQPR